jgi:hypothetical protein
MQSFEKSKMFNTTIFLKALGFAVILFLTAFAVLVAETQVVLAKTYIITASADAHSTISPSGNVPVASGTPQSLTFKADAGYIINNLFRRRYYLYQNRNRC